MKLFGQLKEALLEKIAGDKPGSVEGQIWYDTVSKVSKYRDDVAVRENVNTNSVQNVSNKTISTSTVQTSTLINNSIEIPTRSDVKSGTTLSLEAYAATATSGQLVYSIDELLFYGIVSNALVPLGGSGGAFTAVDTTAVINALPREEGTLYYATDTDKIWAEIQADTPLFNGADGSLHILNGQTVNINAGEIKDYTDVTIDIGGTLNLTDTSNSANLIEIYSATTMVINGEIIGRPLGITSNIIKNVVSVTGKNIYYSYFIKGGGNGGISGYGSTGGLGGEEVGGGGGSSGAGGNINANGDSGTQYAYNVIRPGGTGGTGTGQHGQHSVSSSAGGDGGDGGGGGGGGGASQTYLAAQGIGGGGGGGAGPYKKHGAAILLGCSSITGSGNIYLSGISGASGGNGGNGANVLFGFGGGGGGGSCGGNGGHLFIEGTSSVAYSISGGAAGGGGAGGIGYQSGSTGTAGTAGPAGDVGTFSSI